MMRPLTGFCRMRQANRRDRNMAEVARRPMTLDEFLRWDDGTETHYELIGGFPVAAREQYGVDHEVRPTTATSGSRSSSTHSASRCVSIAANPACRR
jgi:hypothetical protein